MYQLAVVSAAAASALLIAPSAHQRVRALDNGVTRRHRRHLRTTVHLAIAGTLCVALSICAVVFLASTLVFNDRLAAVLTGVIAALVLWTWFEVPLVQFRRRPGEDAAG